jgi:hypothetical protein
VATDQPEDSPGHAFISYVREDSERVDRLTSALNDAGLRVWRDTENLWPGQDWSAEIRRAIREDALAFLACFSNASQARDRSYQREELVLACEQVRLRAPGRVWMIPIRFDECDVPDYVIGAGRYLSDLNRVDLLGEYWHPQIDRLITITSAVLKTDSMESDPVPSQQPDSQSIQTAQQIVQQLLVPNVYLGGRFKLTPKARAAIIEIVQSLPAGRVDGWDYRDHELTLQLSQDDLNEDEDSVIRGICARHEVVLMQIYAGDP